MSIHHLNCGTLHPPSRLLVNGQGGLFEPATMACRCLLIPTGDTWTLVDTGIGKPDLGDPIGLAADHLGLVVPALRKVGTWRLRPVQWAHRPSWVPARMTEEYAGRPAARINDRVRLVALDGHLDGHCGVVIDRPGEPTLIHAGDAIFSTRTLQRRAAPIGLAAFERYMRTDVPAWRSSRR